MSQRRLQIGGISARKKLPMSNDRLSLDRMTVPGNFVNSIYSISYLVIGGGGSSGLDSDTYDNAGGGAGGMLFGTVTMLSGLTLSISVGGGGTNSTGSNSYIRSSDANASMNVESSGGGRGGYSHRYIGYNPAYPGGSGGGAGGADGTTFQPGATGIPGQGNNGGGCTFNPGSAKNSGGGGGAGGVGQNGTPTVPGINGAGGAGLASPISGTPVTYARGGNATPGVAGAAGTGNGADAGVGPTAGKSGGSGVVFVKVPNNSIAIVTGSPILTSTGDGNTSYKFVGTGTMTFN